MEDIIDECSNRIKKSEANLVRLELAKKRAEEQHRQTIRYMQIRKARKFYEVYGQRASDVRKSYDDKLATLVEPMHRGGKCHDVKLLDLGSDLTDKQTLRCTPNYIRPGWTYLSLPFRHYETALLTKMEEDAFAVIDKMMWIDPEAHCERWGV